jgi:hypothetical protein
MRRREVYKHDAFDNYVNRLLHNWVISFPLPSNGRALLLEHITHEASYSSLWMDLPFAILRWTFRNLILAPIDIAFQPVLYFSDVDLYPTYVADKMLHQSFIG